MLWLSGWFYRKNHVINPAAGAGASYQVRVTVHYGAGTDAGEDVYCSSLCRTDFGDIRFTDGSNNLLDYWLQSKTDGANAVFWVKIAGSLEETSQTVYVYYGKSDASTTSNQAATFVDVISGVVGAWNMEEANASDPVHDYSGNGNNGTATGTTVVAGKFTGKNARNFVANDKITVLYASILHPTIFSWFGWIKLGSLGVNQIIVDLGVDSSGKKNWLFRVGTTNHLALVIGDEVNPVSFIGTATLDTNWHFVGFSKNGNAVKIYYDNTVDYNNSLVNTVTYTSANLTIGYRPISPAQTFVGTQEIGVLTGTIVTDANMANVNANYPDVTLEAGKVCVRKWATSTQPTHDVWGGLERLVVSSDSFSAADGVLRDKLLGVSDSVGVADALWGCKALLLSDSVDAVDGLAALKTLLVGDAVGLSDLFLALKGVGVADSLVLFDWVSVPLRVRAVLDSVCSADGLTVNKVLRLAEDVFVAETVEVGSGDRRTRLFLVLGNVAVQLTKNA